MPEKKTRERAKKAKSEGKSESTQAGEYVREEIEHVRKGKHGAKSAKQAIAIGLSKARRDGVEAQPPKSASKETKKKAKSTTRSRATTKALKKESTKTTSRAALSRQAKSAAKKRSATSRSKSAKKGATTRKRTK